jgi:hypothetical protein
VDSFYLFASRQSYSLICFASLFLISFSSLALIQSKSDMTKDVKILELDEMEEGGT